MSCPYFHWLWSCLEWRLWSRDRDGLSGLRTSELRTLSVLLGLAELAMEKTPESAWLAGESLLFVSRGDSDEKREYDEVKTNKQKTSWLWFATCVDTGISVAEPVGAALF